MATSMRFISLLTKVGLLIASSIKLQREPVSDFSSPFLLKEYSDKIQKQIPHPALKTHVYELAMGDEKKDGADNHWLVEMMQEYDFI